MSGAGYSFVDVDDVEPEGPGGAVRFLRRAVGATAFGFNWFELPPGAAGPEHDEVESAQEEVMIVLAGSGLLRIEGSELELHPRRVVRLDPAVTRQVIAGVDGLTFVTVGAPRDTPYVARGPF